MADEKQPGSGFGGNNLVLLAVAAASAVYLAWQKPPLEASRPAEAEPQIHYTNGVQDVDARLWQDPFGAVAEYIDAHQNTKAGAPVHDISSLGNLQNTLVLGVTLPGGRSPVDIEERRRLRYAILAAIHTEKYIPADAEHIGYLHIDSSEIEKNPPPAETLTAWAGPIDAGNAIKADDLPPLRTDIPFEWFNRVAGGEHSKGAPQILVMWLNEGVLDRGRPIGHLKRLVRMLDLPFSAPFTVIGPHDSTTLTSMVREIESSVGQLRSGPALLNMYNFAATADDETVMARASLGAGNPKILHEDAQHVERLFLEKAGIHYYRSIATDKVLASALAEELKRRSVDPRRVVQHRAEDDTKSVEIHPDHIALISEWDSVYGQTLPEIMSKALAPDATAQGASIPVQSKAILRFSYLRGLDGRLPNRRSGTNGKSSNANNAGEAAAGNNSKAAADTARELEIAKGQGQFDYLRRLADQMRARDLQLRQRGEGKIVAIGVLGSDVYDKLLILQALKPEFPGALFFTTDLDALLLSGSKSEYARNLIVASSFDLRLRDAVQEDIPPFRNAYQTSVFLSTRLAVRNAADPAREAETRSALKRWLHEARLFEISRTRPLALPADVQDGNRDDERDSGRGGQGDCAGEILDCNSIMPQAASLFPTLRSGSLVSAGLLGAILLFCALLSSRTLRQLCLVQGAHSADLPSPAPTRIVWIILLVAVALSVSFGFCAAWPALAAFLTQHGVGEPMALFEGVSVWPTIVLRAAGLVLSLWLISHTVQSLKANLRDTETEMRLPRPHFWFLKRPYLRGRGRSWARHLIETLALSWFHGRIGRRKWSVDQDERPKVPILYLSVRYAYYGRTGWRFCRAGVATLAMFALWWLLWPIFGQLNAPIRGHVTQTVYQLVTILNVFATLFLIFLVADATLYSRSFVKQLTSIRSEWPKSTVDHFKNTLGLDPSNLDDWIDIQFLVKRTKFITTLIYFPALMFALLVVSRSPVFDSYTVTPTLVIAQAISVIVIIGSVFSLRWAAESAREAAVNHLTDKITAARGPSGDGKVASQLEMLLGRVQNLREGAFAPLSSQPIVKAVLLPLLSYGSTVLIQMYALPTV